VLNYIENSLVKIMSETNNDSFRTEMIIEIKKIQSELNKIKTIKKNIVKKSTKRKPSRQTVAKKKIVKRKPARKDSKLKRKATRRR